MSRSISFLSCKAENPSRSQMKNPLTLFAFLLISHAVFSQCDQTIDLAFGRPAVASSVQSSAYPATNATDGDTTNSRWSSSFADNQYMYVDLGAVYSLCQVKLYWEAAYGKDFDIDISTDSTNWTTVQAVRGNTSLKNSYSVSGSARYVRMFGIHRGTAYGFSLIEMLVFGYSTCNPTNLALNRPMTASSTQSGYPASNAGDGLISTRWASDYKDSQWLYVDLGATHTLCQVDIAWQTAYASDYNIDVSNDAMSWVTVDSVRGNTATGNINNVHGARGRYVRVFGIHRATSYGFSIDELHVTDMTVLAAEFLSFAADVQPNGHVLLKWTIADAINNGHFVIERSSDDVNFVPIGKVSHKSLSHTWTDSHPPDGQSYYRLYHTDDNGKTTYSQTVVVRNPIPALPGLTLSPNPAVSHAYLQVPSGITLRHVKIYNAAGMHVHSHKGHLNGNRISLDVSALPPGIYFVHGISDHHAYSIRFLKN